ncbi:Endonuclease/Exonuclease/phosphatase family protein [Limihaloglobus sulfuriphilus]|uniref:Endonuclease/Exonuclease/phosphatase family protein n=1 Tax=Limihaloglobus sulfuriphilus TaxID=1851148 RepID=A0A1Q2MBY8_9BACT|nr:hypothetical protein [Limihaloglobus sulfuriphilus]AQQ70184.1 Endonuclease/Exonuclease/phosphatase family protein [Limihaloglobus sulfuriphilus]
MFVFALAAVFCSSGLASIRIATYNIAQGDIRNGLETVLAGISQSSSAGISKPFDLLVLQEQDPDTDTTIQIKNIIRGLYPDQDYRCGNLTTSDIGIGGSPGAVYNYKTLRLLEERAISTPGIRTPIRYKFSLANYPQSPDTEFYVYVCHLKASQDSAAQRADEAEAIRSDADALGAGKNVIIAGDLNLYSSSESAWAELTAAGNAQMHDAAVGGVGYWHDNSSFRHLHSQAPSTNPGPGLVGAGMDDRFDFQMLSSELMDDAGFSHISGTYRVLGNNGSHQLNESISTGSGGSAQLLNAIMSASDHCPVILEYQLPAVMNVQTQFELPAPFVVSTGYKFPLLISNSADTQVSAGADELDYHITLTHTLLSEPDNQGSDYESMTGTDVGSGQMQGSFDFDEVSGGYSIDGAGVISGMSENFYYVYKPAAEQSEYVYRLNDISGGLDSGTAGMMLRGSLETGSVYGYLYATKSGYLSWRRRTSAGAIAMTTPPQQVSLPVWLKVSVNGGTLAASYSPDGTGWNELVSESIGIQGGYAGLAVSSGSDTETLNAVFSPAGSSGGSAVIETDGQALAAGDVNNHSFFAGNAAAGTWTTSVSITSDSKAVKDGSFDASLSYVAVEHDDVTGDGVFSLDDINTLLDNMESETAAGDYDGDGVITLADLDLLLEIMGIPAGDTDLSGRADSGDFFALADNWLRILSGWQNAELNGDGVINYEDCALMSKGFIW